MTNLHLVRYQLPNTLAPIPLLIWPLWSKFFSRRSHFTLQYLDSRWLSVVMSIDVTRAIFITLLHTFQINPAFCSKIPYIYRKYLLPSTKYPHTVCWGQSKQEWQNKSLFKLFDRNGGIFWLITLPIFHTVCKYDPFLKSRKAARLKKILAACIYVCRGLQLPSNSVCGGFDKYIVMRGKNWSLLKFYNTLFTFFIWLAPLNSVTGAWTEHHADWSLKGL